MTAIKEDPKPMTERSYVYFIPTLTSGTGEELSASKFREELKKAPNLAAAKKLYTKQFGHYNEHVFSLIYSKLKGKSSMNEQVNLIRKLAGLAEAAPVHFGQDGDPAKAKFVPGSDSAAGMSIANRFPEGADVNDPATKKEEFLKALVSAPAALLAEINGRLDPKDHNSLQVGERLNEIISQLESSNGALSTLSADDKSFAVALTANAVKNMSLDRGDTGAAPEEEDLKDSFNLDELRIRAGISQADESMSADHNDDDDDDYEPSTFKDEWGRDTEEQDQWKKNVTGKKNKQGMSESPEDDDDESVGYDDEDDNDWESGIDWDEEEDADDEEDYVDESQSFNEEKLPMVKLADIMADYGLTEAGKPDFLDLDKDGDKKEPMKQAAKDAEEHKEDKEDKEEETKESVEEHITSTTENAVQQALSELRKLAGL